jgi:uncharacterized protein
MLVEFRVKNFKSYKDEQVFSLVSTGAKDESLPDNLIQATLKSGKEAKSELTLISSAVIYGSNASGKSNLVDALKFAQDIIAANETPLRPRSTKNDVSAFQAEPFLFDKTSASSPCEFEFTFIIGEVRYQYGFSLDFQKIHQEWLIAFPEGAPQTWFERTLVDGGGKGSNSTPKYNWSFRRDKYRKSRTEIKDKTRFDRLFLTIAKEFNDAPLIKIHNWFAFGLKYIYSDQLSFAITLSMLDNKVFEKHQVVNLLKEADLGVADLTMDKVNFSADSLPSDLPEAFREELIKTLKDSQSYKVRLLHYTDDPENMVQLPIEKESFGTRRLLELSGPLLFVLKNGYTLFVDELEASLHPLLVRKIIGLFGDKKINRKGAQLIFTSHNVSLLSAGIFRRDQIWFVEKRKNGSSNLYPLTDIHPRKEEALEKNYLEGRYGAIPNLGNLVVGSR